MTNALVRKPDGSLVEMRREASLPDLVLEYPDTDHLLINAQAIASKTLAAMQRAQKSDRWTPDSHHTKMLKELVDVTLTIEAYKQKTAGNDALSNLSEDEILAKLRALAIKKFGLAV